MSVYETVKQYVLTLAKRSVGPLPIKSDDNKVIFSPGAQGPAISYLNMLP